MPCCRRRRRIKVLVLGLDATGKTTLLYRLGAAISTVTFPGKQMNTVESASVGGVDLFTYDLGGSDAPFADRIPPDMRPLFNGARALIFVVDAADADRMQEVTKHLHLLLAEPALAPPLPLLVFLNKQDLASAIGASEASTQLGLTPNALNGRRWRVQPTCTTTHEGVVEGFEWLSNAMRNPWPP